MGQGPPHTIGTRQELPVEFDIRRQRHRGKKRTPRGGRTKVPNSPQECHEKVHCGSVQ